MHIRPSVESSGYSQNSRRVSLYGAHIHLHAIRTVEPHPNSSVQRKFPGISASAESKANAVQSNEARIAREQEEDCYPQPIAQPVQIRSPQIWGFKISPTKEPDDQTDAKPDARHQRPGRPPGVQRQNGRQARQGREIATAGTSWNPETVGTCRRGSLVVVRMPGPQSL